jgi:hypothetical protein
MTYTSDFGKMLTLAIPRRSLQPWINGFAFQRQHAKNAFVDSAEGLFVYESLQCFQS